MQHPKMTNKYPVLKKFGPLFFLFFSFNALSQNPQIFTTSGSITVPAGVTQVTVEVWGAGGGGGASWNNSKSAGGGGGGAYTIAVINGLVENTTISYIVGSGGLGGWNPQNGTDGGATTFLSVKANGGGGGGGVNATSTGNGGSGGVAETLPLGVISYAGGAGRSGISGQNILGGGGGSSAGINLIGTNATGSGGAAAPPGGGNGGDGSYNLSPTSAPIGRSGYAPGGGGGGGPDSNGSGTGYGGGNGGDGQIRITWSTLDFIGTVNNDYVDFGNNHSLTSNFSLEAWVLQKASVLNGTIISKGNASSTIINKRGYHLFLNNGKPNLIWYDNTGVEKLNIQSPTAIPIDKWYHIAATYDGTTNIAILYIDGVEVKRETPFAPPTIGTEKFLLGAMYDSGTPTTPKNNFNGYIDEVRVWEVALSAQQIREMMNQEIQLNAVTLKVRGKTIPKDISGVGLTWANLKGYYPMNDNTANDKSNNGTKHGSPKNMTTFQPQTAPLPYKSLASGPWSTPATWLNSTVQNIPNSIINLNGIDTEVTWNIVETSHNISSTGNKTLLGLIVKNSSTITAGNDTKIQVSHYLKLDGIIDLQGKSQLVQTLNSDLEPTSAGSIKRNQQGVGNKYSYNYWSSPVGPINAATNNNNYTVAGVFKQGLDNTFKNTTNQDITWIGGYDGNINTVTKQISLARYWLWKFENGKAYSNWVKINEYDLIRPSQGFTLKGASAFDSPVQNYTFVGKPHNGNIAANSVLAENYFLVGNPYPSALDSQQFIADNVATITGTIYFWEQSSDNKTHNLAGYTGGYSTLTGTGGVGPIAPAGISGLGLGSYKIPKQFIPVGQGFYVIGKAGMSSAQPIVFNNSQRGFHKEGIDPLNHDESTYLFKNGVDKKGKTQFDHFNDNSNDTVIDEKLVKIRLGFNTSDKFHRQLLLGFMNEKATDGEDYGYDAEQIDTRANDMFFPINNAEFIIQGVGHFDVNKIYPLGISITVAGNVQFVLDEVLNLPSDVSIGILDKLSGETHNISQKAFEINLEPGTYLDRFALTFKTQKLVAEDVKAEILIPTAAQPIIEGIHVVMNNAMGELQIKNNSTEEITSVALVNTLGQTIKTWNSNFNIRTISLPISTATGVYLVQINTKTGKTVKKISVQ
ncbi:MAG: LamG-like jellyroll fold domain-containing protein [Lutibacter sp.]|nr:LamG-like jellyroll fold domain-containing protein [Lutibacter sp.]